MPHVVMSQEDSKGDEHTIAEADANFASWWTDNDLECDFTIAFDILDKTKTTLSIAFSYADVKYLMSKFQNKITGKVELY